MALNKEQARFALLRGALGLFHPGDVQPASIDQAWFKPGIKDLLLVSIDVESRNERGSGQGSPAYTFNCGVSILDLRDVCKYIVDSASPSTQLTAAQLELPKIEALHFAVGTQTDDNRRFLGRGAAFVNGCATDVVWLGKRTSLAQAGKSKGEKRREDSRHEVAAAPHDLACGRGTPWSTFRATTAPWQILPDSVGLQESPSKAWVVPAGAAVPHLNDVLDEVDPNRGGATSESPSLPQSLRRVNKLKKRRAEPVAQAQQEEQDHFSMFKEQMAEPVVRARPGERRRALKSKRRRVEAAVRARQEEQRRFPLSGNIPAEIMTTDRREILYEVIPLNASISN
ncbi:unnamed protein product [Parascedosporium putredinis]|uniref:Uncharacterized protein n=1 Tax=Parascedosporium putredinis TaxID=1442378 RepID=A0A9P1H5K8_9PEZI|nr:unnamed protein product [Parascedosporium putredinis]CAI7999425.1 unnamed protein product [Parascedosporium putredinis]